MPNVGTIFGPLEPLTIPKDGVEGAGRTFQPQDFNKPMRDLWAQVEQGGDQAGPAALSLLRLCLPGITDDEIAELDEGRILWVFAYCARRLEEVAAQIKAAGAAATANPTPPSAPTTSSNTPLPASRARSGKTGSRSRSSRSTAPSTASIG